MKKQNFIIQEKEAQIEMLKKRAPKTAMDPTSSKILASQEA